METMIKPPFDVLWHDKQFTELSPIQSLLYPVIEQGESVIAISPTGTGKTLAYLLPLLQKIEANQQLQLIVLAPSQELVKQISEVAKEWAAVKKLQVLSIIGNANVARQIASLKNKPEIIVASPGRLLELSQQTKKLKFHQVSAIVYDEADYLLEDEQFETVEKISNKLLRDVQKIWVSATYGPALQKVKEQLPSVKLVQTQAKQSNVEHFGIVVQNRQKLVQLKKLAQVEHMQAMVFFEQINEVDQIASKLTFEGVKVAILHSQLTKMEREYAIQSVKQGKVTYLLTTDIAARGLDIDNLPCVIHYNRVKDARTYFHRSGRTGRMGKQGTVISLLNEQEFRDVAQLLQSEQITLEERYLYQGYLVSASEREALRLENMQNERVIEKSKPKAKSTDKKSMPTTHKKMTNKKKNRQRDTKNKGKRKTK